MLQLVGYYSYELRGAKPLIDDEVVAYAVETASRELADRVYDATYFELSDADKDFLFAMLEDDGPTRQSDMAGRLDRPSGHVSKYKKRLLQAGVIDERARGQLEFCLPGFKEYLVSQRD
jgi:hypothetical protein